MTDETCRNCGGELVAATKAIAIVAGHEAVCKGSSCAKCGEFYSWPGDIIQALVEAERDGMKVLADRMLAGEIDLAQATAIAQERRPI